MTNFAEHEPIKRFAKFFSSCPSFIHVSLGRLKWPKQFLIFPGYISALKLRKHTQGVFKLTPDSTSICWQTDSLKGKPTLYTATSNESLSDMLSMNLPYVVVLLRLY